MEVSLHIVLLPIFCHVASSAEAYPYVGLSVQGLSCLMLADREEGNASSYLSLLG